MAHALQVHTVKRPSQYAHRGKALLQEAEALGAAVIVLSPRERDFSANSYQRSMARRAARSRPAWGHALLTAALSATSPQTATSAAWPGAPRPPALHGVMHC